MTDDVINVTFGLILQFQPVMFMTTCASDAISRTECTSATMLFLFGYRGNRVHPAGAEERKTQRMLSLISNGAGRRHDSRTKIQLGLAGHNPTG